MWPSLLLTVAVRSDRRLRVVVMTNIYKVFDSLQSIFHVCSFKVILHRYTCTLGNPPDFWGVGSTLPVLPTCKSRLSEFRLVSFYHRGSASRLGLAPGPNPIFRPDPLLPPTGARVAQRGPLPPAWSQDSALTGGGNAVKSHEGIEAGRSSSQSACKAVRHEATSPIDTCSVFRRWLSEEKHTCRKVIFRENSVFWWGLKRCPQRPAALLCSSKRMHTELKGNPDSCPLCWGIQWCPQQRHPLRAAHTDIERKPGPTPDRTHSWEGFWGAEAICEPRSDTKTSN